MKYAAALVTSSSHPSAPWRTVVWRARMGLGVAVAVMVLAGVETVNALVAPHLAPTDADWVAASATVRAGFRAGDLIVAAPAWADQLMRLHLGDLVPIDVAGRMDAARFARVWEIGQRGARSPEADGTERARVQAGALRVRLVERKPAIVTYDFLARWDEARLVRREPTREIVCSKRADRLACPDLAYNFTRPALLEIDGQLKRALYTQPVGGAVVVLEYPHAVLGRELAFATGLHNVWLRKQGEGHVLLKVFVDGTLVAEQDTDNRSGFALSKVDTSAWAGRTLPVRFEISSAQPFSRHFGFVAEARIP